MLVPFLVVAGVGCVGYAAVSEYIKRRRSERTTDEWQNIESQIEAQLEKTGVEPYLDLYNACCRAESAMQHPSKFLYNSLKDKSVEEMPEGNRLARTVRFAFNLVYKNANSRLAFESLPTGTPLRIQYDGTVRVYEDDGMTRAAGVRIDPGIHLQEEFMDKGFREKWKSEYVVATKDMMATPRLPILNIGLYMRDEIGEQKDRDQKAYDDKLADLRVRKPFILLNSKHTAAAWNFDFDVLGLVGHKDRYSKAARNIMDASDLEDVGLRDWGSFVVGDYEVIFRDAESREKFEALDGRTPLSVAVDGSLHTYSATDDYHARIDADATRINERMMPGDAKGADFVIVYKICKDNVRIMAFKSPTWRQRFDRYKSDNERDGHWNRLHNSLVDSARDLGGSDSKTFSDRMKAISEFVQLPDDRIDLQNRKWTRATVSSTLFCSIKDGKESFASHPDGQLFAIGASGAFGPIGGQRVEDCVLCSPMVRQQLGGQDVPISELTSNDEAMVENRGKYKYEFYVAVKGTHNEIDPMLIIHLYYSKEKTQDELNRDKEQKDRAAKSEWVDKHGKLDQKGPWAEVLPQICVDVYNKNIPSYGGSVETMHARLRLMGEADLGREGHGLPGRWIRTTRWVNEVSFATDECAKKYNDLPQGEPLFIESYGRIRVWGNAQPEYCARIVDPDILDLIEEESRKKNFRFLIFNKTTVDGDGSVQIDMYYQTHTQEEHDMAEAWTKLQDERDAKMELTIQNAVNETGSKFAIAIKDTVAGGQPAVFVYQQVETEEDEASKEAANFDSNVERRNKVKPFQKVAELLGRCGSHIGGMHSTETFIDNMKEMRNRGINEYLGGEWDSRSCRLSLYFRTKEDLEAFGKMEDGQLLRINPAGRIASLSGLRLYGALCRTNLGKATNEAMHLFIAGACDFAYAEKVSDSGTPMVRLYVYKRKRTLEDIWESTYDGQKKAFQSMREKTYLGAYRDYLPDWDPSATLHQKRGAIKGICQTVKQNGRATCESSLTIGDLIWKDVAMREAYKDLPDGELLAIDMGGEVRVWGDRRSLGMMRRGDGEWMGDALKRCNDAAFIIATKISIEDQLAVGVRIYDRSKQEKILAGNLDNTSVQTLAALVSNASKHVDSPEDIEALSKMSMSEARTHLGDGWSRSLIRSIPSEFMTEDMGLYADKSDICLTMDRDGSMGMMGFPSRELYVLGDDLKISAQLDAGALGKAQFAVLSFYASGIGPHNVYATFYYKSDEKTSEETENEKRKKRWEENLADKSGLDYFSELGQKTDHTHGAMNPLSQGLSSDDYKYRLNTIFRSRGARGRDDCSDSIKGMSCGYGEPLKIIHESEDAEIEWNNIRAGTPLYVWPSGCLARIGGSSLGTAVDKSCMPEMSLTNDAGQPAKYAYMAKRLSTNFAVRPICFFDKAEIKVVKTDADKKLEKAWEENCASEKGKEQFLKAQSLVGSTVVKIFPSQATSLRYLKEKLRKLFIDPNSSATKSVLSAQLNWQYSKCLGLVFDSNESKEKWEKVDFGTAFHISPRGSLIEIGGNTFSGLAAIDKSKLTDDGLWMPSSELRGGKPIYAVIGKRAMYTNQVRILFFYETKSDDDSDTELSTEVGKTSQEVYFDNIRDGHTISRPFGGLKEHVRGSWNETVRQHPGLGAADNLRSSIRDLERLDPIDFERLADDKLMHSGCKRLRTGLYSVVHKSPEAQEAFEAADERSGLYIYNDGTVGLFDNAHKFEGTVLKTSDMMTTLRVMMDRTEFGALRFMVPHIATFMDGTRGVQFSLYYRKSEAA